MRRPVLRADLRQDVDRRLRANERQPDIVGIDHKGRSDIGHFQRAGTRRITHQHIGGAQADGIERPADRNAQTLMARPAEILHRRQQTGRENAQSGIHAAASRCLADGS